MFRVQNIFDPPPPRLGFFRMIRASAKTIVDRLAYAHDYSAPPQRAGAL